MTRVVLTFDNGPTAEVTPAILDRLAARGIRAYFFVLGKHLIASEGRALVARALSEGHRVGNHSFYHEVPLGSDPRPGAEVVDREIIATQTLLDPLLLGDGSSTRLFRPFGGGGHIGPHLLSPAVRDHLVAEGYSCVLWDDVPRDWDDPSGWVERALAGCEAGAHRVMVLHDIPGACLDRLDAFLDAAGDRGVSFDLDLPARCLPIEAGVPHDGLASIVAALR